MLTRLVLLMPVGLRSFERLPPKLLLEMPKDTQKLLPSHSTGFAKASRALLCIAILALDGETQLAHSRDSPVVRLIFAPVQLQKVCIGFYSEAMSAMR